jgi:hypothetical protein
MYTKEKLCIQRKKQVETNANLIKHQNDKFNVLVYCSSYRNVSHIYLRIALQICEVLKGSYLEGLIETELLYMYKLSHLSPCEVYTHHIVTISSCQYGAAALSEARNSTFQWKSSNGDSVNIVYVTIKSTTVSKTTSITTGENENWATTFSSLNNGNYFDFKNQAK